jgi:site-specific DNA-methyltransferase (cytosine-N4-specific)
MSIAGADPVLDAFAAEQVYLRRPKGLILLGDNHRLLEQLPTGCCTLVTFAPPFVRDDEETAPEPYLEWMSPLFDQFARILRPGGSVVMELGNQWARGTEIPKRSTISYEVLAHLFTRGGWHLLQELHWYNPGFLPTDRRWLDDRIRFRDSVTPFYWMARTLDVRVDTSRVWGRQAGTLASADGNLLAIGDGPDDVDYVAQATASGHGEFLDRQPAGIPRFFIDLLTVEDELVVDPFGGSCTTGMVAEQRSRRWICIEATTRSLQTARLRFPE